MKHHFTVFILLFVLGFSASSSILAQDVKLEKQLEEINNFYRVSDQLASAGQILYDEVSLLKESGFDVVINLAPANDSRNGLEGFLVTDQELTYIHIPVSWQNPAQRDLKLFFDIMRANTDRKVFVHCQANLRASTFVYLYRSLVEGLPEEKARADMEEVWQPEDLPQWANFIAVAQKEH